jgi:hypothetical protein
MTNKVAHDATTEAIAADLRLLKAILSEAIIEVERACRCIARGERNGAIGTVAGLDVALGEARALYGAALALHRNDRTNLQVRQR